MERLRIELDAQGHSRHYVGINVSYAAEFQHELVDRCAFPLFQDSESVNTPLQHHIYKDDMAIYDSEGKLAHYLPMRGGDFVVDLSSPEGYENVKELLLSTE